MQFLNICIPCFNHNVSKLVEELYTQCINENIEFQIIIFEDGSYAESVKKNSLLIEKFNVKHIVSEKNVGRSAARNRLAKEAKKGKIIFLDADSRIYHSDFIKTYKQYLEHKIVSGGRKYLPEQYQKTNALRYKYGLLKETKTPKERNKYPNTGFATNNFMIDSEVFEIVQFNESLKNYGHEDSLFGYELLKNGIKILHIDNPVVDEDIEENSIFLYKTEEGIKNLILIEKSQITDKEFINEIKITKIAKRLKKLKLIFVIRFFNSIFKNKIKRHLLNSSNPNLFLFDFYKLSYYCTLKNKEQ